MLELSHPKSQAFIGQIPLGQLDFLINAAANRLITNPEHEGKLILKQLISSDMYNYDFVKKYEMTLCAWLWPQLIHMRKTI